MLAKPLKTEESITDFFDAIHSKWTPTTIGAAGKEVWGCLSWKGKQSAQAFVDHVGKHFDTSLELVFFEQTRTRDACFIDDIRILYQHEDMNKLMR